MNYLSINIKISFLALLFCLSISHRAVAQDSPKHNPALYQKIATQSCVCFDELDMSDFEGLRDDPEKSKALEYCFGKIIFQHKEELGIFAEVSEADFNEQYAREAIDAVGQEMSLYITRACPKFFELMLYSMELTAQFMEKLMDDVPLDENYTDDYTADSTETYEMPEYDPSEYTIEGTVKTLKNDVYTYLVIQDKDKKEHELVCLYYFEQQTDLLKNFRKYKNKKVRVEWYEDALYHPSQQKYLNIKYVSWLELVE